MKACDKYEISGVGIKMLSLVQGKVCVKNGKPIYLKVVTCGRFTP